MAVEFRLVHTSGLSARANFASLPTWTVLAEKICTMFTIPLEAVGASYQDSDGDKVTLKSQEGLELFYKFSQPTNMAVVNLKVFTRPTPDIEAFYESAWGKKRKPVRQFRVKAVPQPPGSPPQPFATSVDANDISITTAIDPGVPLHQDYVCYGDMNITVKAIDLPDVTDSLVVRGEYDHLLQQMVDGDLRNFKRLVVTGNEGTGKTMFLIYVLLKRMEEKRPTAIQTCSDWFLIFDNEGPTLHKSNNHPEDNYRLDKCWALADGNSFVNHPHVELIMKAERIIQFAPSQHTRWKEWAKQFDATVIVMDLPSVFDVAAVAHAEGQDVARALELMGRWGPELRTIGRFLRDYKTDDVYSSSKRGT